MKGLLCPDHDELASWPNQTKTVQLQTDGPSIHGGE